MQRRRTGDFRRGAHVDLGLVGNRQCLARYRVAARQAVPFDGVPAGRQRDRELTGLGRLTRSRYSLPGSASSKPVSSGPGAAAWSSS